MTDRPKPHLIDGSSYIYRAFFAIGHLSSPRGIPTQAVFGFVQMIRKIIDQEKPEYLAVVFDAKGPTFSHELYIEYKAHRPGMPDDLSVQVPILKKSAVLTVCRFWKKRGFEADDIIATLTKMAEAAGFEVIIISGDKDLLQLIFPSGPGMLGYTSTRPGL